MALVIAAVASAGGVAGISLVVRLLTACYPLVPLAPDAPGGTEQVAFQLLAGLAQRPGFELITVAAAGSRCAGRLLSTLAPAALLTPHQFAALDAAHNARAQRVLGRAHVGVVHNQGASLYRTPLPVPTLLTLHLPPALYPPDHLRASLSNLHLVCVSRTQHDALAPTLPPEQRSRLHGWIGNGIAVETFDSKAARANYLLFLGRICPEKAPHLAIALARRLRRPLVLAGAIYPFAGHREYAARAVFPHLSADVRWCPNPSAAEKRGLLAAAAAVVVPAQLEETSSLVAMEAAASGAPVLAFSRGALPELIRHGETGFLGNTVDDLARHAAHLSRIKPHHCHQAAQRHFTAQHMVNQYAALFHLLTSSATTATEV